MLRGPQPLWNSEWRFARRRIPDGRHNAVNWGQNAYHRTYSTASNAGGDCGCSAVHVRNGRTRRTPTKPHRVSRSHKLFGDRACDHFRASEPHSHRRTNSELLSDGQRNCAPGLSVATERNGDQRCHVIQLHNPGDDNFRERLSVHSGGQQQRGKRNEHRGRSHRECRAFHSKQQCGEPGFRQRQRIEQQHAERDADEHGEVPA